LFCIKKISKRLNSLKNRNTKPLEKKTKSNCFNICLTNQKREPENRRNLASSSLDLNLNKAKTKKACPQMV